MSGRAQKKPIYQGRDLFIIAGLPRDQLRFVISRLSSDKNLAPARYRGAPAPVNDWSPIYTDAGVKMVLQQVAASISDEDEKSEPEQFSLPTPRRIYLLYVSSDDSEMLLSATDFFCLPYPLEPEAPNLIPHSSRISWRHNSGLVFEAIKQAISGARSLGDHLKGEITDKTKSALVLPPLNFYHPDARHELALTYRLLSRAGVARWGETDLPMTVRVEQKEVAPGAFKGSAHADQVFEDSRGRLFPPDPFHAKSRPLPEDSDLTSQQNIERSIQMLKQRYRFGVLARDGNLHFDVQYRRPRELKAEPMTCIEKGEGLATGSHANVGVNDHVWLPDGNWKPTN